MKQKTKNIIYGFTLFIISITVLFMGFDFMFNNRIFYYIVSMFLSGYLLANSVTSFQGGLIKRNKYNELKQDLKVLCNKVIFNDIKTKDKALFLKMYHKLK